MRRLEIGGGPHPAHSDYEQFDAIDWKDRTGLTYTLGDARALPYEDGVFGRVFSSNLLEHFPADETTGILAEWTRVLQVGGTLEMVVPDTLGIVRDFFDGVHSWVDTQERLLGSQDYDGNRHYAAFTLCEFPSVIAHVPQLDLQSCVSSHRGGGVHSISVRIS